MCILLVLFAQVYHNAGAWGSVVVKCSTSRTVPGSIPGGVTGDFFPWYPQQNHVPWGRLSLWKWVPGISPGVKAAGAFGWRPTTLVVPKRQEIRALNLPLGPPQPVMGWSLLYLIYYRIYYQANFSDWFRLRHKSHKTLDVIVPKNSVFF